jgi:hypothetical protein
MRPVAKVDRIFPLNLPMFAPSTIVNNHIASSSRARPIGLG